MSRALRAGAAGRARIGGLLDALGAILADGALEPAFVALALTLPGEADIAREIGRDVDPDAIFAARVGAARGDRARISPARCSITIAGSAESRPYTPDAASAGRRALRNTCLDLLAATRPARRDSLAARAISGRRQHDRSHGGALDAVAAATCPSARPRSTISTRAIDDDPLIVDKWFALQAMIPEPATLDRVQALTAHPAFSLANPNRVRALIGAFALANQTQFNRADGAGYDFVVDTVLALDRKNPQVAARLLSAFKSWRVLEPGRRAMAEAALAAGRRRAVAVARRGRHRAARACRRLITVPVAARPASTNRAASARGDLGDALASGHRNRSVALRGRKASPDQGEAAINKT